MLDGKENIIKLIDTIKDEKSGNVSIVMEYVDQKGLSSKELYPTFKESDVKYYMYSLLKAINYANSHGLFHRDLKLYKS